MKVSDILDSLQDIIYSRENDMQEKIQRLKQANRELNIEQNRLLQEIRKIIDPDLEREWMGKRATNFDTNRNGAFSIIEDIGINDYDKYQREIENKITSLERIQSFLHMTKSIAYEAENLAKLGEEAAEALEDKIGEIKRRLL